MASARDRRQIAAAVDGLERFTERAVIRLTLDVHAGLVRRTPVDTGWARANWIPRVGRPQAAPVGTPQDIGPATQATSAGRSGVLAYRLPRGSVFVSNAVDYIQALNDGHSQQESPGFVQRAIQSAVNNINITPGA
ncbi:MAG: hypothetical protein OXE76_04080 [Alphaproteobacteria bacterium]|nr:hypothetical protein [Alphaproteobacteria bacterium]